MRTVIGWGLLVVMAPCPLRMLAAQEHTTVGGYGEVHYTNPTGPKTPPVVNLARFVVYLAHSFDDRLAFRSELEVEDAKLGGGGGGGGGGSGARAGLPRLPPGGLDYPSYGARPAAGRHRQRDARAADLQRRGEPRLRPRRDSHHLARDRRRRGRDRTRWQRARLSGVSRERAARRRSFGRRGDSGGTPGGPPSELREPIDDGAARVGAPGRQDRRLVLVRGDGRYELGSRDRDLRSSGHAPLRGRALRQRAVRDASRRRHHQRERRRGDQRRVRAVRRQPHRRRLPRGGLRPAAALCSGILSEAQRIRPP